MDASRLMPYDLFARGAPPPDAAPPPPVPLTPEQLALLPHDDLRTHLNASIWTMIGVSATFLALRLYCKLSRHTGLWWDDYILIGSWVRPGLIPQQPTVDEREI